MVFYKVRPKFGNCAKLIPQMIQIRMRSFIQMSKPKEIDQCPCLNLPELQVAGPFLPSSSASLFSPSPLEAATSKGGRSKFEKQPAKQLSLDVNIYCLGCSRHLPESFTMCTVYVAGMISTTYSPSNQEHSGDQPMPMASTCFIG